MTEMQQLVNRQAALQQEAGDVRDNLNLDHLLRTAGNPVLVGSAALGLMVWEDLDLTVVCDSLDLGRVLDIGRRLAAHPDVHALTFRNDTGRWNVERDRYPDGLYLGLRYQRAGGAEWKLDLWFVDEPERQPDLQHVQTLPPLLTEQARQAILAIKTAWHRRPDYGSRVCSANIYAAVLHDGVRDVAAFDEWLQGRGALPTNMLTSSRCCPAPEGPTLAGSDWGGGAGDDGEGADLPARCLTAQR